MGVLVKCSGSTCKIVYDGYTLIKGLFEQAVSLHRAAVVSEISMEARNVDKRISRHELEDFQRFCSTFNPKGLICEVDEHGSIEGLEKQVYALAIMRAVSNGDFGTDDKLTAAAISALWAQGHRYDYNSEIFNKVFTEFFYYW